jgi:hypothetical protein
LRTASSGGENTMSKTRAKVYGYQYRSGRQATKWERVKWFFTHRRARCEDWVSDYEQTDMDFLVGVFAVTMVAIAAIMVVFAAKI